MPQTKNKLLISFNNPYLFEQSEHKEVDLKGLHDLSTTDIIDADKEFAETGQFAMMNEVTTGYACIIASKATKLPVEFFLRLPAKEGLKVKRTVMNFLNN